MSVVQNLAAQWSQNGPAAGVLNPNIPDLAANKSLKDVCRETYAEDTSFLESNFSAPFCKVSFDRVSCWPPTPANTTAVIKCMAYLNNIRYDDTQNATRFCQANGTWHRTNYSACREIIPVDQLDVMISAKIYIVGYTISLITLAVAVGIFIYFKELRCLRNTIHINLMFAYMLMYIVWLKMSLILPQINYPDPGGSSKSTLVVCTLLTIVLHYFHLATFFWMLVEGLYLYILVVETLTRENFKLRVYVGIGWGLPIIIVTTWAVVRYLVQLDKGRDPMGTCIDSNVVDWIHQAPTVIVLLFNLVFLLAIMWVLITKLRSANSLETQQYRKAAKALLVLTPLLGVTYMITLYGPTSAVFDYTRAVLLSTQGFSVALFYCFLNTEVQNTIKHHFDNWKTSRSLAHRLRSGSRSKDWSPRSRTESIRLYSQPTNIYHKRESCASDITTTTLITVNGRTANGSQTKSSYLHPHRTSYPGNV